MAITSDAIAVAHVRIGDPLMTHIANLTYVGDPDPAEDQKLIEEVTAYLQKKTGLQVNKLSRLTVVMSGTGEPWVTVILEEMSGSLKGKSIGDYQGRPLIALDEDKDPTDTVVAAQAGNATIIGDLGGVKAALDAQKSASKRLRSDSMLGKLLAKHADGAALIAVVDAERLPKKAKPIATQFGVRSGVLAIGSHIRIVLHGENAGLTMLHGMASVFTGAVVQEVENALNDAKRTNDTAEAVGAMIGLHHARRLAAAVKPKLEGDTLTIDTAVKLGDPAMVVAVIGVLAAVAIPEFMKYIKKSQIERSDQQRPDVGAGHGRACTVDLPS